MGLALFLAVVTQTNNFHCMIGHFEIIFFGYLFLSFFNDFIKELYDLSTFCTDEMVMMFFESQFIFFPLYTK